MTGSKNGIIGRMLWQRWISKSFARNTFVESLHSLPRRVIQIHWLPPRSKTWSNGIIIPRRSINTLEQSHSEVYQTAKPKLKPSSTAFIIANSVALLPSISKLAESTVNSRFHPNEDSRFKFVVQLVYVIFFQRATFARDLHILNLTGGVIFICSKLWLATLFKSEGFFSFLRILRLWAYPMKNA